MREDSLGEHHGARREQHPQFAQRAGAGQDQVQRQADHHRRQAEQRVDDDDQQTPAGKAENRQAGAERQPDRIASPVADRLTPRERAMMRAKSPDPTVVQKSAISPLGAWRRVTARVHPTLPLSKVPTKARPTSGGVLIGTAAPSLPANIGRAKHKAPMAASSVQEAHCRRPQGRGLTRMKPGGWLGWKPGSGPIPRTPRRQPRHRMGQLLPTRERVMEGASLSYQPRQSKAICVTRRWARSTERQRATAGATIRRPGAFQPSAEAG